LLRQPCWLNAMAVYRPPMTPDPKAAKAIARFVVCANNEHFFDVRPVNVGSFRC
jgi:hypothetical protein